MEQMGFSYDLYTHTHTKIHEEVAQDILLTLDKHGYIYEDAQLMPLLRVGATIPLRPIRRRHLPGVQLRRRARRPVRRLRPNLRPYRSHQHPQHP